MAIATTGRTYAIGDLQGCLAPLKKLLALIDYRPAQDTLWFTGDLVNRGPASLDTLRFVSSLPATTISVLGNHDLTLLAADESIISLNSSDTMHEILEAPDKAALITWLRHRPLLHYDSRLNIAIVHAGIYPFWSLTKALALANELEGVLRGANYYAFLQQMYGNQPLAWNESLVSWERLRFIVNVFTRMRFCTSEGNLDFSAKGNHHSDYSPWFKVRHLQNPKEKVLFGHWAALKGKCEIPNVIALDSGCVWGNCLTAFCLETQERFQVNC